MSAGPGVGDEARPGVPTSGAPGESIRDRLARGVAWMFAGSWIEQAINLAVSIALARRLGAEAFGVATLALAVVVLAELLVRETLTEAVVQAQRLDDGDLDALFWTLGGFATLLVGGLVAAALPLARWFDQPAVAPLLAVGALSVLSIGWSGVPVARLRRDMRFDVMARRALVGVVAGGAVGVGMAWAGYGPWALVGQRLALTLANDLVAWLAAPWRPRRRARWGQVRELWSFGSRTLGLRAAEIVDRQAPLLVVGYVLGATALGLFFLAWRIVELLSFLVVSPFRYAAHSAFAAARAKAGATGALFLEVSAGVSLVACAAFAGLAAIAGPAVRVAVGSEWSGAAPALATLALAGALLSLERIQQAYALALGVVGPLATAAALTAVAGVALVWFAAGRGLAAVGLAVAARAALAWMPRLWILARRTGLAPGAYLASVAPPALLAVAMAAAVWALLATAPLAGAGALTRLAAGVGAGCLLYGGGVLLFLRPLVGRLLAFSRPDVAGA